MNRKTLYWLVALAILLLLLGAEYGARAEALDELLNFIARTDSESDAKTEAAKLLDSAGKGTAVAVFNPCAWTRSDVVDMPSPFPGQNLKICLKDEKGQVIHGQTIGDRLYFTAREVPAMGYKIYHALREPANSTNQVSGKGFTLENKHLLVAANARQGSIARFFDKNTGTEMIPASESWALPLAADKDSGLTRLAGDTETVLMESGPVKARVTFDHYYNDSQVNEDVVLHDSLARMDLFLTIDWQEPVEANDEKYPLRMAFPLAKQFTDYLTKYSEQYDFPAGYGSAWAKLSGEVQGLLVCADFPAGFEVSENSLIVSIPRTSIVSEDLNDLQELMLWFLPEGADTNFVTVFRTQQGMKKPLTGVEIPAHKGEMGKSRSFMYLTKPEVIITDIIYDRAADTLAIELKNAGPETMDAQLVTLFGYGSYKVGEGAEKTAGENQRIALHIEGHAKEHVLLRR